MVYTLKTNTLPFQQPEKWMWVSRGQGEREGEGGRAVLQRGERKIGS